MLTLLTATFTQSLTFLPLALAISISYTILRATDMTLDGSFVLGAAVFARLVTLNISPPLAAMAGLLGGALAGILVSTIQKGGRVDPLLAGILASFMLASGNLILMGRPNISLLTQKTLVSTAFAASDIQGWTLIACYTLMLCGLTFILLRSRFGLRLRALGDNPHLFQRLGKNIECYRRLGFVFTNMLAAGAGILTAQTVGYADINMGFGMTLTGIGAIILGQQIVNFCFHKARLSLYLELISAVLGVLFYFFVLNTLLNFALDPIYLKLVLSLVLITAIRMAVIPKSQRV